MYIPPCYSYSFSFFLLLHLLFSLLRQDLRGRELLYTAFFLDVPYIVDLLTLIVCYGLFGVVIAAATFLCEIKCCVPFALFFKIFSFFFTSPFWRRNSIRPNQYFFIHALCHTYFLVAGLFLSLGVTAKSFLSLQSSFLIVMRFRFGLQKSFLLAKTTELHSDFYGITSDCSNLLFATPLSF